MARRFGVSFLVVLLCGAPAAADPPLEPRPQLVKPVQIEFNDRFLPNVITVKFRDGLTARLQDGILTDLVTGDLAEAQAVLATVAAGTWRRTYSLPEAQLTALRETARQNLGRVVADPNLRFNLFLPPGTDAGDVIDAFNALDCVELALPIPKPVPLPVPPDFQPNQVYQNGGPSGVSAEAVWNDGITGTTIKVADIEYSWNLDHLDLPPVTILGFPPVDPFNDNNHGAAVLGEVAAISNGWGVTGIAHGAEFFVVGTWNGAIWDVGSAIITSLGQLGPGDVIIIEQQIDGPTGPTDFVPIEWWPPWYDAIVIAVGNAVIVVEAAGNGGQNLDDAIFSTGNFGHWPFLPENDSGAIIVGAGAAPSGFGSDVDRSRLWFSTYGSTVDLQGWGESVWTTGYGNAFAAEGVNQWYTSSFAGTSSATPIVAGAAALLEAAYKDATGGVLPPGDIKLHLQETGWPQQSGTYPASQNIGPRPDAQLAILAAVPIEGDDGFEENDSCAAAANLPLGVWQDLIVRDNDEDWYAITLGTLGRLDVAVAFTHAVGDIDLELYDACAGTVVAASTSNNDNEAIAYLNFGAGGDFYLRVFLDSGTFSQYDLTVDIVPPHDDCAGAAILLAGTVGFSNVGATTDGPGELGLCSFAGDSQVQSDVWYRYFAQCTGQATVSLCGSGYDTKIAVYGASCPTGPGEVIVCNNDACGLQSEVTFAVVESTFYRLRIGGHQGAQGLGTITITCTDVLPCPWDLNGDGVVNVLDLIELVMSFGPCENCPADFDDDGFVGVPDLITLLINFGPCPGTECVWDVNGDGVVDQSDVVAVTSNMGPCEDPENCPWDVNGDGVVDGSDVQAVATHFGPCP